MDALLISSTQAPLTLILNLFIRPFEGRVVPTPALAARSERRQRREGAGEGFGSRTSAGAGASASASAGASASRPARVPPSTPEEVEAARRGEWDYGQFK